MTARRSRLVRPLLAVLAVTGTLTPTAALAEPLDDAVTALELTPAQMVAAFDEARLPNLHPVPDPPPITGDVELDDHIRALGEARGYQRRFEPSGGLVIADGRFLQPTAAVAWEQLQAAAAEAGHAIAITSGYRSAASQRQIWLTRMGATTDEAIDVLMQTVAVPGYSKHHTGYAVDLRSGGAVLYNFASTPAYEWLSADNFANAMRYGWLPSYPEGVENMGPSPEPWEFVYVGLENIRCAVFEPAADVSFCDTTGSPFTNSINWMADHEITLGCDAIRFCPNDVVTRAQAATFLWRFYGSPDAGGDAGFDDVPDGEFFTTAVGWMVTHPNQITLGTTATTFSPHDRLTRAQFVTFLWRSAGRPDPVEQVDFDDVPAGHFARAAVEWAASVGITFGTSDSTFSPDGTATRAQVSAFLNRFWNLLPH